MWRKSELFIPDDMKEIISTAFFLEERKTKMSFAFMTFTYLFIL